MFSKTNLVSTLVVAVWAYFGGYLLWEIIGASLFSNPMDSSADQVHLIIACVISAFAFSSIYSKLSGAASATHGLQYGIWAGIFIGFGERWFVYAFASEPVMNDAIIGGVLNIVFFMVAGALAGIVYQKLGSSAA